MFETTYCLRRKPGMSREAFYTYWVDVHGAMVVRHQRELAVRRYVQTHALPAGSVPNLERDDVNEAPYDGVAELWYDSKEAYLNALKTPDGRRAAVALYKDAFAFIDVPNSPMFAGEEHVLVEK